MEWKVKILEKGRVTIPQELRARLGLKKGDEVKFLLEEGAIRLVTPRLEEDIVERTKGVLKGIESELTPEELEKAFLTASASKVKAGEEA